jgi:two-component system phosphate regulon sensor histidine kinase PhoR
LISGFFLIRSVRREIEQRAQLEVANAGQENLIHIMNHQIKGYLGTARSIFAELSQGNDYGEMPEASKPLLSKGLDEMAAGVDYVQGILRSDSAQSGAMPYTFAAIDLKNIVSDLVSKQKEIAEKAGLSFESKIDDGDYTMQGDATMLEEAFKNLITNAIKYNNPNGNVTVALSRSNGKFLFSVKDTGLGISADDAKRFFTPGGVGKNSIHYNVEASGFGLSFVKPVVEKHNGKVWYISNAPEKGSTFFIELPVS